jgi:transposase-like protein
MDRDALALLLSQGLSLAEIGRRFGRNESTIGYWVQKHGLKAVHVQKHGAARPPHAAVVATDRRPPSEA